MRNRNIGGVILTGFEYFNTLDSMMQKNSGVLRTKDVVAANIPRAYLSAYAKQHLLENVQRGIYLAPDSIADGMYLLQSTFEQSVFSHETALFLHDLTDREPLQYTVTVKTGYNPKGLVEQGVKVYKVKKELFSLGLTELQTPFGRTVKAYNKERTICDIIRNRNTIDFQTVQTALKQYVQRKDKNLPLLMRYAKELRVDKVLYKYLEVLV